MRAEKVPAVYMLASKRRGTLYIGVTSNLVQRVWQHRESLVEGFSRRYGVRTLVWYELHPTMLSAIAREKAMKKWLRDWKVTLIERTNPHWADLWGEIVGAADAGDASERAQHRAGVVDSRLRGNDGLGEGAL